MNTKSKEFIKNFSYTLSSNLVTMVVSAMVVFVIPKIIGVNEYGYWQLFLFYSSYLPFLQLGWTDGIYLRYGGLRNEELDKKLFFSQFLLLVGFHFILGIVIFIFASNNLMEKDKGIILKLVSIYMILINIRYFFTYVLQATNRFKEFSRVIIIDRIVYVVLIFFAIVIGYKSYIFLIYADLVSKLLSLLLSMYICKDIAFQSVKNFKLNIEEAVLNIKAGIQIMFANTASMLIIGIIRLGIEKTWNVSTFGKVSLTLSISKFMMVFINAIGLVMFPVLRRAEVDKLTKVYFILMKIYLVIILAVLSLYFPLKEILIIWLPEYADSLFYMGLLFPMSVYEGKMALIIKPYLKTLRKENVLLKINLLGLLLGALGSLVSTIWLENLTLAVLLIVVVLGIRTILAEIILSKILKIKYLKSVLIETGFVITFVLLGLLNNIWTAMMTYIFLYLVYLILNRKYLIQFKNLVFSS